MVRLQQVAHDRARFVQQRRRCRLRLVANLPQSLGSQVARPRIRLADEISQARDREGAEARGWGRKTLNLPQ